MLLKRDFYKTLENIVGPENVSEDTIVIESYAVPGKSGMPDETDAAFPRYEAITLPQNTQEVQAIVKACNRYKVQYKASSTGWGNYADPVGPNCIKLDLRRMNHIVEINEKNMYAVVEPYVIGAELQAEVMKRGLNCNVTGAGSNCSALPLAAHANLGHLSQSGSFGERNLLGVEWITGDGEIVRLGSLGSSDEWFCGDGPGPSLRGIIRGNTNPLGGLGVFTKAAQKLYHWPGPPVFPIEGTSPHYTPKEIPNFMCRYFSFPTQELMINAVMKVSESEISFILMGFPVAFMASNMASDNINEELDLYDQFVKEKKGPGFMVIIAGNSPSDFEYKKHVLNTIIEENQGESLKAVADPKNEGGFLWRFIRVTASIRETSRVAGFRAGLCGGTDLFPLMVRYMQACAEIKLDLISRGLLMDDGVEPLCWPLEHGHLGHSELLGRMSFTCANPAAVRNELVAKGNQMTIDRCFGVPHMVFGDKAHNQYGPHASNYHLLLRKIKKTFDPNGASEASSYITVKE